MIDRSVDQISNINIVLYNVKMNARIWHFLCVALNDSYKGMEYTVLGDAVNLAARLMANAPANGILIDESTKRHGCNGVKSFRSVICEWKVGVGSSRKAQSRNRRNKTWQKPVLLDEIERERERHR